MPKEIKKYSVEMEPLYWATILTLLHEQISTAQKVVEDEKTAIEDDEFVKTNLVRPIFARAKLVECLADHGVLTAEAKEKFGMEAVKRAMEKSKDGHHGG